MQREKTKERERDISLAARVPPKYVIISTGDTSIPRPREEFDQNVSRYSPGMLGEVRAHLPSLRSSLSAASCRFSPSSILPHLPLLHLTSSLRLLLSSFCPRLYTELDTVRICRRSSYTHVNLFEFVFHPRVESRSKM